MDITIAHPDFKTQLLEMRISGVFYAPRILINGVPVKKFDGVYAVLNDAGQEVTIRINTSIFNRLPQLLIEQDEIRLSRAGWTQFAGWDKSFPAVRARAAFRAVLALAAGRKLNKTI